MVIRPAAPGRTARAGGNSLLGVIGNGIRKAAIEIERKRTNPLGAAKVGRRTKSAEALFPRQPFKNRSEGLEVLFASEEPAIMSQAVGANLESLVFQLRYPVPVDAILGEREVEGGPEAIFHFHFGYLLDPFDSQRAFHIMGKDYAAAITVRPEANMRTIFAAEGSQTGAQPFLPEVYQCGFTWPLRKFSPPPSPNCSRVDIVSDCEGNQILDEIVNSKGCRRSPVPLR